MYESTSNPYIRINNIFYYHFYKSTGSIIDIGFTEFNSGTNNLRLNGDYNFKEIELLFPDFDQGFFC